MRSVITSTGIAVVAGAVAIGLVRRAQRSRIARDVDELFAAMEEGRPAVITEADLADLPEPVQRWLRYSRVVGRERPRAVRLKQRGEFRLEGRDWMPFEAEEYYTTDPPGFVWTVSMRMFPLISVTGRDQYQDGVGAMKMQVSSLIPVLNKRGGNLDQGTMLRYLNEIMWFPAGALSPHIDWEESGVNSAMATMRYGGVTASAIFSFDDEGRLVNMVADRYNDARDALETWSTPIIEYGEFNGIKVPVEGEGVWKYDTGDFPYVRLRIIDLEYDVPERY